MLPRMGLAGVIVAGLAAFAAAALAEPPSDSLRQALEASAQKNGDRLIGKAEGGELDDADEVIVTFEVDPGKTYKLFGVCNSDCTDLLVSADDAKGKFIDTSLGQSNGTPVLEIDDFEGSTISVEVFMMNCKANPCAFAVSLAEDPDTARTASRIADLSELIGSGSSGRSNTTEPASGSVEDLVSQLNAKESALGFALVGEIGTGKLGTGEAMRYFYDADLGAIYHAFALCNCGDLNLVARDDDDKALDSDLASDNRPIIEVTSDSWPEARRQGRQRLVIEVKMARCSSASCGFAVGLYKSK